MVLSQLRVKILLTMIAVVVLSVLVFNLLLHPMLRDRCIDNTRHKVGLTLASLQHGLSSFMAGKHKCDFFQIVSMVRDDPSILGMRFADHNGIVRYSDHESEIGASLDATFLKHAVEHHGIYQYVTPGRDGQNYLSAVITIDNDQSCQECHDPSLAQLGFLNMDLSLAETETNIALVRKYYILFIFVTVVLLGLSIGLIHVRFVQRSILGMTKTISEFENGDLSARMNVAQEDELGNLAQSFNRMADKLQALNQQIERHHQEQLERVEKIATTGELAASVAHEIKNPASGIANAMQVILSDLTEDDERRPIYEEIVRQVNRMNKAISDLLLYAQPSAPVFEILDVADTIERALRFVEPQAQNSSVNIVNEYNPKLPPINADRKQIEQVLLNLFINAIQAMPGGGKMTIRSWEDADNQQVRIAVSDSGTGVPLDKQADVFKPFYTTKAKGSGLGLAICRRIMHEHHGRIELQSESGKGATFVLTFPIGSGVRDSHLAHKNS